MNHRSIKLYIHLISAFALTVVVGTVSHEYAHYVTARLLGYKAQIHYSSTTWQKEERVPFDEEKENCIILTAGVLQTIITGTAGLLLLLRKRRLYPKSEWLVFKEWVVVFLTLFWLRQTVNCISMVGKYVVLGEFSRNADEVKIEQYLHLPTNVLSYATGVIGSAILIYIIVTIIPVRQRLPFILSGFIGGIGGYVLWIHGIGYYALP